jgi:hypothetical protein
MEKLIAILKIIFYNLLVDTLFGLCAGFLLVMHFAYGWDVAGYLALVVGYVVFNIMNKTSAILNNRK